MLLEPKGLMHEGAYAAVGRRVVERGWKGCAEAVQARPFTLAFAFAASLTFTATVTGGVLSATQSCPPPPPGHFPLLSRGGVGYLIAVSNRSDPARPRRSQP